MICGNREGLPNDAGSPSACWGTRANVTAGQTRSLVLLEDLRERFESSCLPGGRGSAGIAAHPSVGGHQGRYEMREIVNALLYQGRTGRQWSMLPHDLRPRSAVVYYYTAWRRDGIDKTIHDGVPVAMSSGFRVSGTPMIAALLTRMCRGPARRRRTPPPTPGRRGPARRHVPACCRCRRRCRVRCARQRPVTDQNRLSAGGMLARTMSWSDTTRLGRVPRFLTSFLPAGHLPEDPYLRTG
ncbi:transposase [Nonomuraea sp. NPDC050643]|uniref:transposase n=1 Tax=Nonomuraea sp. NPDC050643 TaxID=3155660 RepID=UPI0033F3FBCC